MTSFIPRREQFRYRNWAVAELLIETLAELKPRFPAPDYDVEAELAKLKGVGAPS